MRTYIRRVILPLLFCTSLLLACRPGVPSDVIPPSKLEDLLYDYHVAQAMAETTGDSVNYRRYAYVRAVFDKYGVTEAEFDSAMVWYSAHSEYLSDIYRRIGERFESGVAVLGKATGGRDAFADLTDDGDTVNIWQESTFRILKPCRTDSRMSFALDADSSFHKGDELLWRFDPRHIVKGGSCEIYAGLYIRFDNDSTAGVTRRIYSNSQVQLRLGGDTAHAVRSVGGFVSYRMPDDDKTFTMLILNNIMLIRMHRPEELLKADSVTAKPAADSLAATAADSVETIVVRADSGRRLSPVELRDSRPAEHSIHVVKERPYSVRDTRRNTNTRKR